MAREVIGKFPEFTSDEPQSEETGREEVKEAGAKEVPEEEKETPSELPAEEKPAEEIPKEEIPEEKPGVDTGELLKQIQGLQAEKEKLLSEIKDLRGQRRELKKEELGKVEEKIEELKDLHPEDVAIIEKILRAKGYITKEEAQRMYYDQVKQEELNKFLEKYPEYKPENDPNDINWNALQREVSLYRMPQDPHLIGMILERAHRAIQKVPSERGIPAQKKKLEIAGVGAGGVQRSSSRKTLPSHYRQILERGGWSEEEIQKIEENLPEE